jgi:hypothetical protein
MSVPEVNIHGNGMPGLAALHGKYILTRHIERKKLPAELTQSRFR